MQRTRIRTNDDVMLALVSVQAIAKDIGFEKRQVFLITTAVSELATNVVKYADSGILSLQVLRQNSRLGIEAIMDDRGPGIADHELAMSDNYSTGGSLGLGLPGTKRLVDEFSLESERGVGTKVRVVVWNK